MIRRRLADTRYPVLVAGWREWRASRSTRALTTVSGFASAGGCFDPPQDELPSFAALVERRYGQALEITIALMLRRRG